MTFSTVPIPAADPPPSSDRDIVSRLKSHDPSGLHQLLGKYGHRVKAILRRELGGLLRAPDVDDALNKAAFLAWRHATTYREDRGKLGTWFYMIARNAALRMLRTAPHRHGLTVEENVAIMVVDPGRVLGPGRASIDAAEGDSFDPKPAAEPSRFVRSLRHCIDRLSPLQQKIIRADLETPDIANSRELAEQFQTTEGSIYALRSRARRALKRAMQKRGFFTDSHQEETGK